MSEALAIHLLEDCPPERFARLGQGLLRQVESDPRPRLLIAGLRGEAVLLGRHQRAASALARAGLEERSVARRSGGGRAIRAGDGTIGVLLALPRMGALLQDPATADKLINRYVRGLNVGLTLAGAGSGAHYFGRDFVSAEGRQIAVVSQDGLASGAVLFEAVVAVSRPLALPDGLDGYPEHGDPKAGGPPHGTLAELWKSPHDLEALAESIATGYGRSLGCETALVQEGGLREEPVVPDVAEDEAGFADSGVADIPIGFAEALVRRDGDRIAEVRLRGDFIAPAFVLRGLERALEGTSLEYDAIGRVVDGAFREPHAAILGVRGLRILPDAILAAAGLP
ncbi:hypothetical protein [Vulgatibacter incomptus]|uniref:Uncharacterized protein n=1 Tax=Vulgatibacter incomptus TaxID=1391653 RepID=A0A0K1PBT9_9BACT|nr:hypothetical protein [Vulgatibacter incomptus]AKU91003.1 hypothetical protein AKJ08_1390 [Vulgatibacter incomptus]